MPDFNAIMEWLLSAMLYVPQKIYELITDVLVSISGAIFDACTVCDFSTLNANLAALPAGVLFILSWFKIGTGLTIITGCYTVRFLIRRLPFIG